MSSKYSNYVLVLAALLSALTCKANFITYGYNNDSLALFHFQDKTVKFYGLSPEKAITSVQTESKSPALSMSFQPSSSQHFISAKEALKINQLSALQDLHVSFEVNNQPDNEIDEFEGGFHDRVSFAMLNQDSLAVLHLSGNGQGTLVASGEAVMNSDEVQIVIPGGDVVMDASLSQHTYFTLKHFSFNQPLSALTEHPLPIIFTNASHYVVASAVFNFDFIPDRPRIFNDDHDLHFHASDVIISKRRSNDPPLSIMDIAAHASSVEENLRETVDDIITDLTDPSGMNGLRDCANRAARGLAGTQLECDTKNPGRSISQLRVASCPTNQAIRSIDVLGEVQCEANAYTPDMTLLQKRVLDGGCGHERYNIVGFQDTGRPIICSEPKLGMELQPRAESLRNRVTAAQSQSNSQLQAEAWSAWSDCDRPCNGGKQYRYRNFKSEGANLGSLTDVRACNTDPCPDPCNGNEKWYFLNAGVGNLVITSFADNNGIFLNGNPDPIASLSRFQTLTLAISDSTNGDFVCASIGDINVFTSNDPETRSWVPERVKGKHFVIPMERFDKQAIYIHALASSTVTAKIGLSTVKQVSLFPSQTHVIRMNGNKKTLVLQSTGNIIVSHAAPGSGNFNAGPTKREGNDFYVVAPSIGPGGKVYGYSTQTGNVGTDSTNAQNLATVKVKCTGRGVETFTPTVSQVSRIAFRTAESQGPACYAEVANGKLGAATYGDGDGSDATMWLPASLLSKKFMLPVRAQHVAFACTGTGTIKSYRYDTSATPPRYVQLSQQNLNSDSSAPISWFRYGTQEEGTVYISTTPCTSVFDAHPNGKEIVLFGQP